MARTVRNAKLDSRSARSKLTMRREPYWTVVSRGCAVGYRRGANGGTWIARFRADDGKQQYESVGAADDSREPDGVSVFSYPQAQERARAVFERKAREAAGHAEPMDGPLTVGAALDAYFEDRIRRGSKSVAKDRAAANVRIVPALGASDVSKLTTKRLRDWHSSLATAAKLSRPAIGADSRKEREIDATDREAVRARRATANRTLTVLKAALTHAYNDGRIATDEPWRKVKPFREADAPVVRYLSDDDARRLVNACEGTFRDLVRVALLTGCRYGELAKLRADDFNAEARTVTVRQSKGGKPRHVALTDEGAALFARLTAGKVGKALALVRDDGGQWKASQQQRPLAAASERAKIEPAATFHILRHTYASALAMRGVPMGVIAAQLGHKDTRMTERHYAHLAPNYVADTVRAALPSLGLVEVSNLVPLKKSGGAAA